MPVSSKRWHCISLGLSQSHLMLDRKISYHFGPYCLPFSFSLLFYPYFFFCFPCGFSFCFVLGFLGFVLSIFSFATGLRKSRESWGAEKKNPKDFLQLLRVICSKQSIPKVNVLETFRSLSPSSLQFSMSKGISTLKGSSNARPSSFKATFPWEPPVSLGRALSCSLNGIICPVHVRGRGLSKGCSSLSRMGGLSPDPGS